MNIIEGKRIETQIRFVEPMTMVADVIMETETVSDNQTKVALINSGKMDYPMNIFIPDNVLELRYESLTCNKSAPFIRNS